MDTTMGPRKQGLVLWLSSFSRGNCTQGQVIWLQSQNPGWLTKNAWQLGIDCFRPQDLATFSWRSSGLSGAVGMVCNEILGWSRNIKRGRVCCFHNVKCRQKTGVPCIPFECLLLTSSWWFAYVKVFVFHNAVGLRVIREILMWWMHISWKVTCCSTNTGHYQ